MFNSYQIETKVCPVTQVVEKSITPDKVVDMYDTVKERVEKDILRTIVVNDNNLKGVIMEIQNDVANFQKKLLFRFTLNEKEYIKTDFPPANENESDAQLVSRLHNYLATLVGAEIIKNNIGVFVHKK